MAGQEIINEISDDGVWFVAELRYHSANQGSAAAVPFQVDGAVQIARAVNFGPAMRASGLFGPDFDESKLRFQLRITHDLRPQRPAAGSDHVNDRLHFSLGSVPLKLLQCFVSPCS